MSREIKIRAWHKHYNKMYDVRIYDLRNRLITGLEETGEITAFFDGVILLEYTGLKDKNGKEIYEGDVLENPKGERGIVVFYDGSFRLKTHESKTSVHYISLNQGFVNNKIIIGNVHENPELETVK